MVGTFVRNALHLLWFSCASSSGAVSGVLRLAVISVSGLFCITYYSYSVNILGGTDKGTNTAASPEGPTNPSGAARESLQLISVCICSDDPNLRTVVATIRSVVASASRPKRLAFHVVTSPELARAYHMFLHIHLPGLHVEVHYNARLQARIAGMISYRKSSRARKSLASPMNFAAFYLHEFLAGSASYSGDRDARLIYMDTDVLVLGDVSELQDVDLGGHPCGAVQFCGQRFKDHINVKQLSRLGFSSYDPKSCLANRGLLVIDVARWLQRNVTGEIEGWLARYRQTEEDLWYASMSQPPWLLAVYGGYQALGDEWNCKNLGRDQMSPRESAEFRRTEGLSKADVKLLGARVRRSGGISPFIVMCSDSAKLLHYNGRIKPWRESIADDGVGPICRAPKSITAHTWSWTQTLKDQLFVSCAEVWSLFSDNALEHVMPAAAERADAEHAAAAWASGAGDVQLSRHIVVHEEDIQAASARQSSDRASERVHEDTGGRGTQQGQVANRSVQVEERGRGTPPGSTGSEGQQADEGSHRESGPSSGAPASAKSTTGATEPTEDRMGADAGGRLEETAAAEANRAAAVAGDVGEDVRHAAGAEGQKEAAARRGNKTEEGAEEATRKKAKKRRHRLLPGGFTRGQHITARHTYTLLGKIVVRSGTKGVIIGVDPSGRRLVVDFELDVRRHVRLKILPDQV